MAGQLEALKSGMQAAASAQGLREVPPEVRTLVLRGLLHGLHDGLQAWIASGTEAPSGGLRAMVALSDTEHRIALDAAAATMLDMYLVRFEALIDVPDVASIGSLGEVHATISAAIDIGAPRYNAGDVLGCCTVYWATMQALILAPVFRGFSGYARALAPLRSALEAEPSQLPLNAEGRDQFAWTLRRALDAVLAMGA
jgi:hypothetical protein